MMYVCIERKGKECKEGKGIKGYQKGLERKERAILNRGEGEE
jgi:hypothetical protein